MRLMLVLCTMFWSLQIFADCDLSLVRAGVTLPQSRDSYSDQSLRAETIAFQGAYEVCFKEWVPKFTKDATEVVSPTFQALLDLCKKTLPTEGYKLIDENEKAKCQLNAVKYFSELGNAARGESSVIQVSDK